MSVIICKSREEVSNLVAEIERGSQTKYVVCSQRPNFTNDEWQPTEKNCVYYEKISKGKTATIAFTGTPFFSVGYKYLICHQGKNINLAAKKKYAEKVAKSEDHERKKRRHYLIQDTKKVDCPAVVNITRVAVILDQEFQIDKNTNHKKTMGSNLIKDALHNDEKINWVNQYYVYVSHLEEHKGHPIVGELNHVRKTKKKVNIWNTNNSGHNVIKHSNDDQENLQILIQGWRENKPEDNFFLRTCQEDEEFLLCYQTKWQKRLLQLYGQDICRLDATFDTSRYSLAMFFLVVQTNVCSLIVAVFVVQQEDTEAIAEGLQKLKDWNEGWSPGHFLVEFNKAGINAVEKVFPGSRAVLCDFHRDKAWEEWTKNPDNGIQDQKLAMTLLQKIASSDTWDKYKQTMKDLEDSKEWGRNTLFRQWLQKNWLPEVKRWVNFFRDDHSHINTTMNNGIERLNEAVKESPINNEDEDTVSSMMSIIVNDLIPSLHKKYSQLNLQFSSVYKKFNETVPRFLHNRPRDIVKHILYRYYDSRSSEHVTKITDVTFNVKGESGNSNYPISLGSNIMGTSSLPSCICPDWKKHKLPCKHFCAVFKAGWSWDHLCPKYRDSPFFTLDTFYLKNSPDNQSNETEEIYLSNIDGQDQDHGNSNNIKSEEVDVVVLELDEEELLKNPIIKKNGKILTNLETLQNKCLEEHKKMIDLLYRIKDENYLKSLEEVMQNLNNEMAAHIPKKAEKAPGNVLKKKGKKKRSPTANPYSLANKVYSAMKPDFTNMAGSSSDLKKTTTTTFRAAVDVSQSEQKIALTSIIDSEGQQWDFRGQGYV